MKKSKILLFGIIALISTAIFYELFLQYEKRAIAKEVAKEEEREKLEIARNKEVADSIANVKANTYTDADSLGWYSESITTDFKVKTSLNSDGKVDMNGYVYHIDDIEIYYNNKRRQTYIVCKNHEKDAFYHEEYSDYRGQKEARNSTNMNNKACIAYQPYDNSEFPQKYYSVQYDINKQQLQDLLLYLDWFKAKYSLIGEKEVAVKALPKKYIDNEGYFIGFKKEEPKSQDENQSEGTGPYSKRKFASGYQPDQR